MERKSLLCVCGGGGGRMVYIRHSSSQNTLMNTLQTNTIRRGKAPSDKVISLSVAIAPERIIDLTGI